MNTAAPWPADSVERRPIAELIPYARNAREHSDAQIAQIAASMREWGWTNPVLIDEDGTIIAGHGRIMAARSLGWVEAPVMIARGWSEAQKRAYCIADNRLAENATWNADMLAVELDELRDLDFELPLIGFDQQELNDLIGTPHSGEGGGPDEESEQETARLAERFLVPPFSVLSARDGWWKDRKRAWLALGIQSELGRAENLLKFSAAANRAQSGRGAYEAGAEDNPAEEGTSVFDPVLCEIAYRWYSPPGGLVLDPFAGGSVRGIVATKLGRRYLGVDLSGAQLTENRRQARQILGEGTRSYERAPACALISDPQALTPIEQRGEHWLKRDDLYSCNGARGGKARATLAILQGAPGAVTCGNRISPMLSRVARVAEALGIPCRGHSAGSSKLSEIEADAKEHGAELVKIKGTNYLSAVKARALRDAQDSGWTFVPFGLESPEYFEAVKNQVTDLPEGVRRIVVTAGSGMTAAAICSALRERGLRTPILAVRVGLDPAPFLDRWAPPDWREQISIVQVASSYDTPAEKTEWWGVALDPHYEAKAAPYVEPGDLFWLTAIRTPKETKSEQLAPLPPAAPLFPADPASGGSVELPQWIEGDSRDLLQLCSEPADFIFSCPPYADLERYSDDPRDLSTLDDYAQFREAYSLIIANACKLLKADRFACFVVGEVRDKRGALRDFVGDTVQAFRDAGLKFYNDAILVTSLGSLPIRAARIFESGRKLGRTHQYVLIFIKGDPRKAVDACGDVEVHLPEGMTMTEAEDEKAA
jgi:ParB-like chromosome segregation protein Spo0J